MNISSQPVTDFLFSHRLSTIINANRIIVIKDGAIAEQGSHDELLQAKGKYADLWSKQVFLKPKVTEGTNGQGVPEVSKTLSVMNDLTTEAMESEFANVKNSLNFNKPRDVSTPIRAQDDKGTASHDQEV